MKSLLSNSGPTLLCRKNVGDCFTVVSKKKKEIKDINN